ncbi:MAG: glycosyltransferase family 2 protein [Bacteroidaceae bacterium]|nr:glycosyltransferase family 2 protein [Bacteroidaceae bacterium]
MQLSVLIPSYRFDCAPLVERLLAMLPTDAEIVVGDDGSPNADSFLPRIEAMPRVRVIRGQSNRGSAAMRNRLAREARGEYLLYMDCDGMPMSDDFLSRYLELLPTRQVVCGSVCHPDALPSPAVSLRYTYEKQAERRFTAEQKNSHPHRCFRTFHFLVPRDTLLACPFDETVRLSGYEDVLFGKRLHEAGVRVTHIENKVLNVHLEANEAFLRKTEHQLRTLHEKREELRGYSSLQTCYEKLERLHLAPLLRLWHRWMQGAEVRRLLRPHPPIWLFQLYKLGYYAGLS